MYFPGQNVYDEKFDGLLKEGEEALSL